MTTLRVVFVTWFLCSIVYCLSLWALAQATTPETANGSLIKTASGKVVGSELIAQKFEKPIYFSSRPSAVDYNASAAGGTNLAPSPKDFETERDLKTSSGSGLDPHILCSTAEQQAARVAGARNVSKEFVLAKIKSLCFREGGVLAPYAIVNVLKLNLQMDIKE